MKRALSRHSVRALRLRSLVRQNSSEHQSESKESDEKSRSRTTSSTSPGHSPAPLRDFILEIRALPELLSFGVPHFDRSEILRADGSLDRLQVADRNNRQCIGLQIRRADCAHIRRRDGGKTLAIGRVVIERQPVYH